MEILDIYDEHGNLTGRTAERSTFLSKGEYFLCAHVILENQDGLFLVQKRSDTKATRPGTVGHYCRRSGCRGNESGRCTA